MDRCTDYQNQMLDYVYDLLDEDVVQDLALHLEHCADCRPARRAAGGQQQLLAAAARLESPAVCFLRPEEQPAAVAHVPAAVVPDPQPLPARPKVLPLARPRRLAWRA